MKKAFLVAAAALLAAIPARASDGPLDLGFAHTGMTLEEFRNAPWPAGSSVLCSGDAGLPEATANLHFDVPKNLARLGGTRCGVFQSGDSGPRLYGMDIAGAPTEIWAKFVPARDGAPRLLQLILKRQPGSFAALADYFTDHFGPAQERSKGLARWEAGDADAAIIEDGGKHLLAYLIDNRLQATLNVRMSQHPRPRPEAQESH